MIAQSTASRSPDGIDLIVAIRTHVPGDNVTLTVERDGETREVEVTLDAKVG